MEKQINLFREDAIEFFAYFDIKVSSIKDIKVTNYKQNPLNILYEITLQYKNYKCKANGDIWTLLNF
jgi:hypothetical protein